MNPSDFSLLEQKAHEMLRRHSESSVLPHAEAMELMAAIPALVATLHRERSRTAELAAVLGKLLEAHQASSTILQQARALLGQQETTARALQAGDCVTKPAWGEQQFRTIQLVKQTTAQGAVAVFVEGGWARVSELQRVERPADSSPLP